MMPTLAEAAHVELEVETDGISLLPTLLGRVGQETHEFLYWELGNQQAARRGKWKAYRPNIRSEPLAPIRLYDVESDVGETTDVALEHPDVAREMVGILHRRSPSVFDKWNFPPAPDPEEAVTARRAVERAAAVRPHPRQLAWQQLEFTCFVHFGVNTFTGREWGTGLEDPAIFDPIDLDAEQWVLAAKAAGMKLLLVTAKHHDGFCLWPSVYTDHDVASSPWRGGRGDVLAEVAAACRKHGLKLGFYLSPADLHEIERDGGFYGNASPAVPSTVPTPVEGAAPPERTFEYVVDDYNRYFLNQLHELLTRYGPVHEVWFDGANPKPGTGQTYAYEAWYDLVRALAPEAVLAIRGPDVRWCGNEAGHTREAEWSVVPIGGTPEGWDWPDMTAEDLGSRERVREVLAGGGHLHWYPAEVNTSIRDGWFWRDEEQRVRPAAEVLDIWYRSVGGNSVFLLNVPPDRRGRFSERDVAVLREVGDTLRATFARDLALGASAVSSPAAPGGPHAASGIVDADPETGWRLPEGAESGEIVLDLGEARTFGVAVFEEAIGDQGQRIERFALDVADGSSGSWREIARGTTVGYRRICRFPEVTARRVRLRILESRLGASLARVGLHREPGSGEG
jgi:alpha-L-fucosidase